MTKTLFYTFLIGVFTGIILCFFLRKTPKAVVNTVHVRDTVSVHDTSVVVLAGHVPEILKGKDSVRLRDSVVTRYYDTSIYDRVARTKYGTINMHDTVTQGVIVGGSATTNFSILAPVPLNPSTTQLLVGVSLLGNQQSYFQGIGPEVSLRLKSGKSIDVGAYILPQLRPLYRVGIKVPIKLK